MNAMVLSAPRPVESTPLQRQEMAIPEPQAGEILLRVRCCGVCHTDLHIVEGEMPVRRDHWVSGAAAIGCAPRGPARLVWLRCLRASGPPGGAALGLRGVCGHAQPGPPASGRTVGGGVGRRT